VLADSNTPVCVRRGEQDYNEPNQVYLKYIVAISAGSDHLMALEKDDPYHPNLTLIGRVYTWGNNGAGGGDGVEPGDSSILFIIGRVTTQDRDGQ